MMRLNSHQPRTLFVPPSNPTAAMVSAICFSGMFACVLALVVGSSQAQPDPDWNVMDWDHRGRTELSFSMFIDKRATAVGDSTAYLVYQNDPQRFTAVRVEVNVGGECWSAESDGERLVWARNDDEFVPCQMFDVLERAYDPTLRAE